MNEASTKTAKLRRLNEKVILIKMMENAEVDLHETKQIEKATHEIAAGKKYMVLLDARAKITASSETLKYGSQPERFTLCYAQAYVVNSTPNRIIGNFIIQFHKPPVPTKLFSSVESALKWLMTLEPTK